MKSLLQLVLLALMTKLQVAAQTTDNATIKQWGNDFLGTEFWIAFMRHFPFDIPSQSLKLYITNPAPLTTRVDIVSYGLSGSPIVDNHDVPPVTTLTTTLNSELIVQNPGKSTKSVHVKSNANVQVQALMHYAGDTSFSSGGFDVLPVTSLSDEYVIATHCDAAFCAIVILAVGTDVDVTVDLRMNTSNPIQFKAKFKGNGYLDGEHIKENGLSKGDVMQIFCKCDLTGTLVRATQKIAVFAGGDFTQLLDIRFKDLVVEQMMPTDTMGTHYILGSSTAHDLLKVVAINANDQFLYNGQTHTASRGREVFHFQRSLGDLAEISSGSPIFVAQFSRGPSEEEFPESVLTLPAPVGQWDVSYEVYVSEPPGLMPSANDSVLLFLVHERGFEVDVFTAETEVSYESTEMTQGNYTMVTLNLTSGGLLRVQCRPSCCRPFGGHTVLHTYRASSSFALRTSLSDVIGGAYNWTIPCPDPTLPEAETITEATTTAAETTTEATTLETTTTTAEATVKATTTSTGDANVNENTSSSLSSYTSEAAETTSDSLSTNDNTFIAVSLQSTGQTTSLPKASTTQTGSSSSLSSNQTSASSILSSTQTGLIPVSDDVITANDVRSGSYVTDAPSSAPPCRVQCRCVKNNKVNENKIAENRINASKAQEAIQKELTLTRKSLSSYKRSKQSWKDDRKSSTAIGVTLGIICVAAVFAFFVGFDLMNVIKFVCDSKKRRAKMMERQEEEKVKVVEARC